MAETTTRPVALVTGAAKRVGRAIVQRLAGAGFDIAFTYLNSDKDALELTSEVENLHRRCLAIRADLTDPSAAIIAIYDAISGDFGQLNVLVNNASIYLPGSDLELSRRLWAIHVESPLLLCQQFGPMLRASRGHVVNMVDLLAERPLPNYLAYSASKAGLWNLTLGLARELAPEVTVNGIAPGTVEWPPNYPQAEKDRYLKRVPLARAGTPQDVADTVHFFCTGAPYITGQIIHLDGGRSTT